jgi:hypothetical protein
MATWFQAFTVRSPKARQANQLLVKPSVSGDDGLLRPSQPEPYKPQAESLRGTAISFCTSMRRLPSSTVGKTQASMVMPVLRAKDDEEATVT